MTSNPKTPPEPGSPEALGLATPESIERHDHEAEKIEEDGEPFDGNFA